MENDVENCCCCTCVCVYVCATVDGILELRKREDLRCDRAGVLIASSSILHLLGISRSRFRIRGFSLHLLTAAAAAKSSGT